MKKLLLGVISVMAACSVYGQAVSYRNFNDTQFGSNNFKLSIKSGARGTNLFSASTFTSPKVYTDEIAATNSSELVIGAGGTTARIGAGTFRVDSPHTFSGSGANLTDIPPTTGILGWPADAAGVLENDGAGNYSWGAGGGGGGVSIARGKSIQVHTNGSLLTLNKSGQTNWHNPLDGYGTTGVYPNDTTLALQRAITNLDNSAGTLWLPNGTYTTTNTIVLPSGKQVFMPHAQFDYGNYDVLGDGMARFYPLHNTNVLFFANNLRRVKLDNINIHGQNTTQTNNTTYIGVASVGPSGGNAEWSRLNIQDMGVGVVLNDMTGLTVTKSTFAYNFIGAATAYKPDAVAFRDTLFVRNIYGAFLMWSNSQFTSLSPTEGYVLFDNCDFGQNTLAAVVVPRGHASFQNCYWESNGTNGEPYTAIQAGMNPDQVYERAFTNLWGVSPTITVNDGSANNFHMFKSYRQTEWKFSKCKEGKFSVNLMNAQADDSLVISDTPIWVTNSSGTGFFVDWSRVFQSNSIVALSNAPAGGAVEYSNGQDVTTTSGETATSFFYNGDDAMQLIHSSGTTGIILGSEADSMLIQENGKDALYAANGLRHLKSAVGSTVSLDYSSAEAPIFGTANPRTLDLANIGNGDFLVSAGGIIRGTNSLTVASVNVTGDFNVTGTIYPTNGFTHPNGVGKFFVPTNAPASNKIWRATSATTAEYADAPDVTQAGQNNLSGSNFVFNLNYTGKIRSLLDYGVDNTGATEMTGLIMAVSQTNKILYAPPGTYKIQYLLLTNQNAMIFGAGMNTKFVLAVPTNNAFAMTLSNQFVLKECWVQGGTNYDFKGGVGQATYGINMNVFGQGRLENVFVSEFQAGVTLGGTNRILDSFQNNDGKIIGGSISNCYIGLYATNLNAAEYATIDNLTIQDCSRAVQLNSAANIFYNGGKIVNNAIGIHCNPSTSGTDPLRAHSQFNGVNMNHSGTFVVGMASQNLSFRDCSMLGTGSLSLTQCTNYVFQGCQMQLSGTAILMSGGSNNMFLGNQFYADSSVTTSGILVGTNAYFDGNLKVGVGELFVNGTTALSADDQVIAARGYKTMTLSSDDGTAANRTFVINRGMPNQQLTIIWSGANQGQLLDDAACSDGAGNVRLSANWDAVAANQTLQLRSNGTDWFEVGRSAN